MGRSRIRAQLYSVSEKRRLLARCPRTGRWLDTGIVVTAEVLEHMGTIASQVFCPHCVTIHSWTRGEATLESRSNGKPDPTQPEPGRAFRI